MSHTLLLDFEPIPIHLWTRSAGTGYHGKARSLVRLHLVHNSAIQQLCDLCDQLTCLNLCPHLQNGVNGINYIDSGELDWVLLPRPASVWNNDSLLLGPHEIVKKIQN